jgi:hypothetical protein
MPTYDYSTSRAELSMSLAVKNSILRIACMYCENVEWGNGLMPGSRVDSSQMIDQILLDAVVSLND